MRFARDFYHRMDKDNGIEQFQNWNWIVWDLIRLRVNQGMRPDSWLAADASVLKDLLCFHLP